MLFARSRRQRVSRDLIAIVKSAKRGIVHNKNSPVVYADIRTRARTTRFSLAYHMLLLSAVIHYTRCCTWAFRRRLFRFHCSDTTSWTCNLKYCSRVSFSKRNRRRDQLYTAFVARQKRNKTRSASIYIYKCNVFLFIYLRWFNVSHFVVKERIYFF